MFDIIALEKGSICASNELSRLVIAQFEPSLKERKDTESVFHRILQTIVFESERKVLYGRKKEERRRLTHHFISYVIMKSKEASSISLHTFVFQVVFFIV